MSLLDSIRSALGIKPMNIGELNRHATHVPAKPAITRKPDPLEGIEITEDYRKVLQLLNAGAPIVFVSGKAGTGKSTLVRYLQGALNKPNIAVVAPTGVAALNISGATIHSFCHLPPKIVDEGDIKEVADRRLYTKLDLLIVDEVSMVRADVMDAIDAFLRKNGRDPRAPFGGTQILLVGDLYQLPPVVTRTEQEPIFRKYGSEYFFAAKRIQSGEFDYVELDRIFRQRDPEFTEILNKIRNAEDVDRVVGILNHRCAARSATDHIMTLTCTNAAADALNAKEVAKLPGAERLFIGSSSGRFAAHDTKLPSPMNLRLKPGAQVMFTKNDEGGRWVNGTVGRVVEFHESSILVELATDSPGLRHEVKPATWESYEYEYDPVRDRIEAAVVGKYTQYPLMLAWAVTIHKGQGKTLERVRVDLGNGAFAAGQVYVALSRCRSIADITLARPIRPEEVICDPRVRRFYAALRGELSAGTMPELGPIQDPLQNLRLNDGAGASCPSCGSPLRRRSGRRGPFMGCSRFPACNYTRNA